MTVGFKNTIFRVFTICFVGLKIYTYKYPIKLLFMNSLSVHGHSFFDPLIDGEPTGPTVSMRDVPWGPNYQPYL